MPEPNRLLEAYQQMKYQLPGHGKRNVQVLQDAFADVDGNLDSDIYGKGDVIQRFEEKMARYLGKEAAVFFPSGTMAQQIGLRIWCDKKGVHKVAYHPLCHLEIHEQDGLKMLHHIDPILLAEPDRLIEMEDVLQMPDDVACLLIELPQREIGGQLPDYQTLVSISEFCHAKGIKLHLDGARLFEVLPYYQKTAAEVCALFDSVYVSFYKGIGAIAGAILAGGKAFTEEAVVWKRRHGGDLISLYPYIIPADYYFEQRIGKMSQYYEEAKELAILFNGCEGVQTLPAVPVSNMFHVHFDYAKDQVEQVLVSVYQETGIGVTGNLRELGGEKCYFELSIGDLYEQVPKDVLHHTFDLLSERFATLRQA